MLLLQCRWGICCSGVLGDGGWYLVTDISWQHVGLSYMAQAIFRLFDPTKNEGLTIYVGFTVCSKMSVMNYQYNQSPSNIVLNWVPWVCERHKEDFYVLVTVHSWIIFFKWSQLGAHYFLVYLFQLLYMFRATMCPSSGELTVSMQHWYFSLCMGGCLVCCSRPDSRPYRVKNTSVA